MSSLPHGTATASSADDSSEGSSRLYQAIQLRGGQRLLPSQHTDTELTASVLVPYGPHFQQPVDNYVERAIIANRKHRLQSTTTSVSPAQRYRKLPRWDPQEGPPGTVASFPPTSMLSSIVYGSSSIERDPAVVILKGSNPENTLILPVAEPTPNTLEECEAIRRSPTNPVGKFMRDMGISAEEALILNLMPYLSLAPRKLRKKYGARKELTAEDRARLTKERNREHARHNRRRKTIFRRVLEARKLGVPLPPIPQNYYDDGYRSEDAETSEDEEDESREEVVTTTTLTTPESISSSASSDRLKERPRRRVQYTSSRPEEFERVQIPSMHYQNQFLTHNPPLREGISFVGVVHRYDDSRAQNDYVPAVTTTDDAPEGNHQNLYQCHPPLKSENNAEKDGIGSEEGQLRTLLKQLLPSYPRIVSLTKEETLSSAREPYSEANSASSPLLSAKMKLPRKQSFSSPSVASVSSAPKAIFHRFSSLRTLVTGFPEDRTPEGTHIEAVLESPTAALAEILRRLRIDCAATISALQATTKAGYSSKEQLLRMPSSSGIQQGSGTMNNNIPMFHQLTSPQTDGEDPLHRSVSTASLGNSLSCGSFCEVFGGDLTPSMLIPKLSLGGRQAATAADESTYGRPPPADREYGPVVSTPSTMFDCLTDGFFDLLLEDDDLTDATTGQPLPRGVQQDSVYSLPSSTPTCKVLYSPAGNKKKLLVSIAKLELLFDQCDAGTLVRRSTGAKTAADGGAANQQDIYQCTPNSQLPLITLSSLGSWTSLGSPTSLDRALSSLADLFGVEASPRTPQANLAARSTAGVAASTISTQEEVVRVGCQLLVELKILSRPSSPDPPSCPTLGDGINKQQVAGIITPKSYSTKTILVGVDGQHDLPPQPPTMLPTKSTPSILENRGFQGAAVTDANETRSLPLFADLRIKPTGAEEYHLSLHIDYKYILDNLITEIASLRI